jgi:nucleoid-associated protein YgaU
VTAPTNGRYADQAQLQVPQADGTTRPMSTPRVSVSPRPALLYQVHEGDRLDILAGRALSDSTRWWVIADANPPADALALEEPGTVLEVPNG